MVSGQYTPEPPKVVVGATYSGGGSSASAPGGAGTGLSNVFIPSSSGGGGAAPSPTPPVPEPTPEPVETPNAPEQSIPTAPVITQQQEQEYIEKQLGPGYVGAIKAGVSPDTMRAVYQNLGLAPSDTDAQALEQYIEISKQYQANAPNLQNGAMPQPTPAGVSGQGVGRTQAAAIKTLNEAAGYPTEVIPEKTLVYTGAPGTKYESTILAYDTPKATIFTQAYRDAIAQNTKTTKDEGQVRRWVTTTDESGKVTITQAEIYKAAEVKPEQFGLGLTESAGRATADLYKQRGDFFDFARPLGYEVSTGLLTGLAFLPDVTAETVKQAAQGFPKADIKNLGEAAPIFVYPLAAKAAEIVSGKPEAIGYFYGLGAAVALTGGAIRSSPVKVADLTYTVEGKPVSVWRGLTWSAGEGKATPLIGLTERGNMAIGVPKAVDMPSLAVRDLPANIGEARNAQTMLKTGVERAIAGSEDSLTSLGVNPADIAKIRTAEYFLDEIRVPSKLNPYVAKELPKTFGGLTEEQTAAVYRTVREVGGVERAYGSTPEMAQRAAEFIRDTHDLEVIFKNEAAAIKASEQAVVNLKGVSPEGTKIEIAQRGYGVRVNEDLLLDFKYEGMPEEATAGFSNPTQEGYGYSMMRPTLYYEQIKAGVNTMEEQFIRKTSASTPLYREPKIQSGQPESVIVEPGVPKSVGDAYAEALNNIKIREDLGLSSAEKLAEMRVKALEWKNAGWRTPGVKEKLAEVDANLEAYKKIELTNLLREPSSSSGFISSVRVSPSSALSLSPLASLSLFFTPSTSSSSIASSPSIPMPSPGPSMSPGPSLFESPSLSPVESPSMSPGPSLFESPSLSPVESPSMSPSPSALLRSVSPYYSSLNERITGPGGPPPRGVIDLYTPTLKKKKKKIVFLEMDVPRIIGERSIYADILSVAKSELLYGKATHPSPTKRPQLWATGEYALGRTPTVELIGKTDSFINRFVPSKKRKGRRGTLW